MKLKAKAKKRSRHQRRMSNRIQASAKDSIQFNGGDVELKAAAEGERKIHRFEMEAYNGGELRLGNFPHPVVVDLQGLNVTAKSRPILREHDPNRVVGHTETIANDGTSLIVAGVVSAANEHSKEIVESSLNGFPWQASIGASIGKAELVKAGKKVTVNGRTFTGPVVVARQTQLNEVSFVALGADDSTSARVAATSNNVEVSMEFSQWLEARGLKADDLDEGQLNILKATYEAELKIEAKADEEKKAAEKKKADEIAAKKADDDEQIDIAASAAQSYKRIAAIDKIEASAEMKAKALEENWSVEKLELESLRASRSQAPAGHIKSGEINGKVLEASVAATSGIDIEAKDSGYDDKTIEEALSSRYRGAGIRAAIHATLKAAGKHTRMDIIDDDVIRAAFEADAQIRAAGGGGGFSTVGLSGILSNVAKKQMLAAYNALESIVPTICSEVDTNDFKTFYSYRMHMTDNLEEVGPAGEIKHTSLSEQEFQNRVKTWARMLTLTRQMMVNDDLSAFSAIPRLLGRSAALTREEEVLQLINDSETAGFFAAGNGNLKTGADGALSIGGLTLVEQLFRDQTDPEGKPILVSPNRLAVPTGLKVTADQLYNETRVNETTTADTPSPANNPHAGKFPASSSPYFNSQGLANSSDTAWYMFANPADIAAFEVAYLRGQRAPAIQNAQADFNTLGMSWRCVFDFGVARQDPRGAVKATGVA